MKAEYRDSLIMPIATEIFRAYDIRGLLEEVTPQVATATARVLVRKLQAKRIVVGRDARATSPALLEAAARGLEAEGATAVIIGECSTSVFNFAVSTAGIADGGMMITASHNPAQYNGIKCADGTGLPLPGKELGEDVLRVAEEPLPEQFGGGREEVDVLRQYIDHCLEGVDHAALAGLRIAVDYGNGMGARPFRALAERLGWELHELYAEPDANFPNHEANPAKPETLQDLQQLVRRVGADFGVAFDGDADRVGCVDEQGTAYRGDQVLAVLAEEVLRERSGQNIIVQPNHSWTTVETIEHAGGRAVLRPIGRTRVVEGMRAEKAVLGGEISNHFFFEEFAGLEAVDYAVLRLAQAMRRAQVSCATLFAAQRTLHSSWEVNFTVPDPKATVQRLKEIYAPQATATQELDGFRCDFGRDWWFIVRPSSTEPLLRLVLEAKAEDLLKEKLQELEQAIGGARASAH